MKNKTVLIGLLAVGILSLLAVGVFANTSTNYSTEELSASAIEALEQEAKTIVAEDMPVEIVVTHLDTPEPVKALYITGWVAGIKNWRNSLVDFIEETEFNAVIIDIKADDGKVTFETTSSKITEYGSSENRIPDIKEFIAELHEKNIYVIGRISVFQDPYLSTRHPELAVKRISNGEVWKDRKGLSFLDMNSKKVWDYVVELAKASYDVGFDEINFDYVRFPSDGDIGDIAYGAITGNETTKADIIENFFSYLRGELKDTGIVMSADLFGMTTTSTDDLNIGQILERAAPHFDYIAPMVYPSHYPRNFNGYDNPNHYPYEIVHYAMKTAKERLIAIGENPAKLRTWIQDFDYGGNYGVDEVRAQIQATYDAGLTSWMVWDPANKYTRDAYEKN